MGSKLLLHKEFINLKRKPKSNYFQVYGLKNDQIHEWEVYIIGPPNTFYEGGIYKALLRFPPTYPIDPPSLKFVCNFIHPNVHRDGKVCISTLQVPPPENVNTATHWRPVIGVEGALLSVVSLLSDPNNDDPANPDAATEWDSNPEEYRKKIQLLAEYAQRLVPEDFIQPVVASSSTKNESSRDKINPGRIEKLPQSNELEDEEDDYVYSDSDGSDDETQIQVRQTDISEQVAKQNQSFAIPVSTRNGSTTDSETTETSEQDCSHISKKQKVVRKDAKRLTA
mmetsp:Transcript_1307/g.1566  ORF Transcript_1307/g.1566 Transcript_1307/m.1566 type:complete len:282 (+) Transcript_1307:179-1024(+)|eukprot:CAMPEP_0184042566 /NCGR_PEP_ID=MMETSP0955-20130417/66419_1 /TAXON_ID=627963 /ORGANISM="Aplanochytrium sp, Strain PBS07" /LENGTH=281 /DNA_ID=CAMNT_0026333341 /DNA_START=377 /DNA_END=1222 /DNA_ORIENTATION=+